MPNDPFPKAAFTDLLRRLPAYGRLAWRLAKDPLISKARRVALVAAAGYLASPIDAVPGIIPVLGQLDDVAVMLAALRIALDGIDPARRQAHLAAVGLSDDDLATDLRALRRTAGWTLRTGARVGGRAALATAKSGGRAAAIGARASIRGVRAAAKAGSRAARAAAGEVERRRARDATDETTDPAGT